MKKASVFLYFVTRNLEGEVVRDKKKGEVSRKTNKKTPTNLFFFGEHPQCNSHFAIKVHLFWGGIRGAKKWVEKSVNFSGK